MNATRLQSPFGHNRCVTCVISILRIQLSSISIVQRDYSVRSIALALVRYLDIFFKLIFSIRMVLKRVKNVHSNGILLIISSFFIRSIRQHKAVLLNVWN